MARQIRRLGYKPPCNLYFPTTLTLLWNIMRITITSVERQTRWVALPSFEEDEKRRRQKRPTLNLKKHTHTHKGFTTTSTFPTSFCTQGPKFFHSCCFVFINTMLALPGKKAGGKGGGITAALLTTLPATLNKENPAMKSSPQSKHGSARCQLSDL